jgi:sporulation protein YlmC with PRC-barrel domain
MEMDLVRDVLDKALADRNGREMGRVDRVVLQVRAGAPPRVAAVEVGPAVLAARVGPFVGRWAAALEHAFAVDEGRPVRIPFREVLDIADYVKVDLAFTDTAVATVEQRLRKRINAIPGSS